MLSLLLLLLVSIAGGNKGASGSIQHQERPNGSDRIEDIVIIFIDIIAAVAVAFLFVDSKRIVAHDFRLVETEISRSFFF